ncbi:MAG TPA: hypothetical protein VKQ54_09675 [Caulobacteraceae bacterium]|nr:hypothetical protein [Caulobacteraceae bacterium]
MLFSADPPEHTFEARLVGEAFSTTYFDSFIPGIRAFVNEKIDGVFAAGRESSSAAIISTKWA